MSLKSARTNMLQPSGGTHSPGAVPMSASRVATAVVSGLALFLAGCGGGGGTANGPAPQDPQQIHGTVTWWDTSDATSEAPAYRELVGQFAAKYPNIKVDYVDVPFSDAQNKFKTAAQGGAGAPDVLRADIGWMPGFAKLGYLQPLDGTPALASDGDYLPGPYASAKFEGKTYGIPQVTDALALLYNRDLLTRAGIGQAPKTWAELKQAALQIKARTGADGIFLNSGSYFLLPFIYGEGGDLVDVPARKITVNDAKAAAGVRIAQDLVTSGAARTDVTKDAYANMQTAFKAGNVAMVINGPWSTSDDLSGPAFANPANLGIAPVPAGSIGAPKSPIGGHDLVVYAGSKNLAAAYLFLRFINATENQAFVAQKNNVLPTRASAAGTPQVMDSPVLTAFQPVLATTKPRPVLPQGGDLFTPLDTSYQKILGGQVSVQEGLDQAAKQFQQILPGWS